MIAYFDTSAIVPLLIEEPGTTSARALWDAATRIVTVRLTYAEARAALAQAHRGHRLTGPQLRTVVEALDSYYSHLDLVEIDDALVRRAGALAETHDLRGYDAVHLAAAERLDHLDLVVVAGDRALLAAADKAGLAIADTFSGP